LPFQNMSGDPEQEYFADGMVEDIITGLSRSRHLFVIARNSTFTYKGKVVDLRQVSRELGVRYVLEGSVRKSANRVRITGQLIDAATLSHLWADRFDSQLDDVFDLQDRVTTHVIGAILPHLERAEIGRAQHKPTESLTAYDFYLRALAKSYDFTEGNLLEALAFIERALVLDTGYSDAWALKADVLCRLMQGGWRSWSEGSSEARDAALRGVQNDPDSAFALSVAAFTQAFGGGSIDQALDYADRAVKLHPHSASVLTLAATPYNFNGDFEKALRALEQARLVNPVDPRAYLTLHMIAVAHFFQHQFDDAAKYCYAAIENNPRFTVAWRFLAASLAYLGRMEEATHAIGRLLALQPNSSLRVSRGNNFRHPWMLDLFVNGLEKAGLPK